MRCYFCGSKNISFITKNDGYSMKKGIVGTAVLGPVGAVAGINGKKTSFYHCNACGKDFSQAMDVVKETKIDIALRQNDEANLRIFKRIHNNIEWEESSSDYEKSNNILNSSVSNITSSSTVSINDVVNRIFEYMNMMNIPISIDDLKTKFNFSQQTIKMAIESLYKKGRIKEVADNVYVLVKDPEEMLKLKEAINNKEKAEKEKKEKEIKNKLNSMTKNIDEEIKNWDKEVNEIKIAKENYLNQKENELQNNLKITINKLENEKKQQLNQLDNEREHLNKHLSKLENELNNLGIFSFSKKKEIQNQIEITNSNIENKKEELLNVKNEINTKIEETKKDNEKERENTIKLSDNLFKTPDNPTIIAKEIEEIIRYEDPSSNTSYLTKTQMENIKIEKTILNVMKKYTAPIKISDLQEDSSQLLMMYSTSKLKSLLLNHLGAEKKVCYIKNGNDSYLFTLLPDNYQHLIKQDFELIDKNINTQFAKDRNYIFNYIKALGKPSTIEEINNNKFSEIRIRQILNSLEEENVCIKVRRNNELYYTYK